MVAKWVYFRLLGWNLVGNTTMSKDTVQKAVLIAAPHTSHQDFFISLVRKVIGIQSNFIAKQELFIWPFGYYFRSIGGTPMDRSAGQNKVQAIAQLFEEKKEFRLVLSPEAQEKRGTRKK